MSSSAVESVGYDAAAQELDVEFVDGGVYRYSGVPQWRVDELFAAASIGSYVAGHIKPHYPYVRVD